MMLYGFTLLAIILIGYTNGQTLDRFFSCYMSGDTTGHSTWCGDNNPQDVQTLKNPLAIQEGVQNALAYHHQMVWYPPTFLQNKPPKLPNGPAPYLVPQTASGPLIMKNGPVTLQSLQPKIELPQPTNPSMLPATNGLENAYTLEADSGVAKISNINVIKKPASEYFTPQNVLDDDDNNEKPLVVKSKPYKNGAISFMQMYQNEKNIPLQPSDDDKAYPLLPINTTPYSKSIVNPIKTEAVYYATPNPELEEFRQAEKILDLPEIATLPTNSASTNSAQNQEFSDDKRSDDVSRFLKRTKLPMKFKEPIAKK